MYTKITYIWRLHRLIIYFISMAEMLTMLNTWFNVTVLSYVIHTAKETRDPWYLRQTGKAPVKVSKTNHPMSIHDWNILYQSFGQFIIFFIFTGCQDYNHNAQPLVPSWVYCVLMASSCVSAWVEVEREVLPYSSCGDYRPRRFLQPRLLLPSGTGFFLPASDSLW